MPFRIRNFNDYESEYEKSIVEHEEFWANKAEAFTWRKRWQIVLEWNFDEPNVRWFGGGKLNITENMLDRHLSESGDQIAIIWEPNDPSENNVTLTYRQLHEKVCQFSNVLKNNGIQKGDRVCIYMPMIPEAAVAILACARVGAVHSVVFGGFSAQSLKERIQDSECRMVITSDGAFRGTKTIPMKATVDEALVDCPSVKKVIVVQRTGEAVTMQPQRDLWWHDGIRNVPTVCEPEIMDAEDPLFILYTSGSTGKPKGLVHTIGGYMVGTAYTFQNVFQYNPGDIYWCTADLGWVTGHSYVLYGPLLMGATTLMFEGIPTHPDAGRFWQVIDKHRVTIFYTAPTAIRSLEAMGVEYVAPYRLDSLKTLGTVGEPINEEAWQWYFDHVGRGRCPIVDTWWQTETGAIMISPLAGITPLKPGFATLPLPGVVPIIVDDKGVEQKGNDVTGNLCLGAPWPAMARTMYGDHVRFRQTYFATYPGLYFTGDGCKRDEHGLYRITGRVDDVINVSGHRIGTAEVENAINEHPDIVESAVVGYPHAIKGQGIGAFVISIHASKNDQALHEEVAATVGRLIGPIAKPDKVVVVRGLPKTRSGKIMRRILRKIAEGETSQLGDTSTLLDPAVVEEIRSLWQKNK